MLDTGALYSWGNGAHGVLGNGDLKNVTVPTLVKNLPMSKVVAVASAWNHTMFLGDKGEVASCGSKDDGKLGFV